MSSGHRLSFDLGKMLKSAGGSSWLPTVTASSTLDLKHRGFAKVIVTATCTVTLPNADEGTKVLVLCDDTSTVTLADSSGTFHVFTGTSGSTAVICEATDSNSWAATRLTRQTTNGAVNASNVAYNDDGGLTTQTDVNGALDEIYNTLLTAQGHIDLPLNAWREVDADGDVSNIAANGGVLASDTTPILEGSGTTNAQRIVWATGDVDRIGTAVSLPFDFDDTADCQVGFVAASGTTNDFDATVVTNWNGGADVTDTVVDTGSATVHSSEATVAAADIPTGARSVSVSITPPAHATDAFHVYGMYIKYKRKLV